MTQLIERDASGKTKGFRLQKLRAAILLLKASGTGSPVTFYYAAIEAEEDVTIIKTTDRKTEQVIEEDKNFDPESNFTIFSHAVSNTLVSFFDIYIGKWQKSYTTLFAFSFYTTAGIGKEKKTQLSNGIKISLPDKPILEILKAQEDISDETANLIKNILIAEYEEQYQKITGNGHLQLLKSLPLEDLKIFLKKINWLFGQEDEKKLHETAEDLIKDSKYYQASMNGKESLILAKIVDKIDEKQHNEDFAERFINSAEVQLIFKLAESEIQDSILDPTWKDLTTEAENISDKRNLEEKILDVCSTYPRTKIASLARKAYSSKTEEDASNKSFLSLKYRAFLACDEYFFDNAKLNKKAEPNDVDKTIKSLQLAAALSIEELKKDYTYSISNKEAINAVVLNLIDSCFICFDEEDAE